MLLSAVSAKAAVKTGYINWTGDAGYTAEIKFDFDDAISIVSAVPNFNSPTLLENIGLINLWTTVRDPQGGFIYDSNGIIIPTTQIVQNEYLNGYSWFRFYFDTQTLSIPSDKFIDVGPTHNKWIAGSSTSLSYIDKFYNAGTPTNSTTVDRGSNIRITVVPEPSSVLLSMASVLGFISRRRRTV